MYKTDESRYFVMYKKTVHAVMFGHYQNIRWFSQKQFDRYIENMLFNFKHSNYEYTLNNFKEYIVNDYGFETIGRMLDKSYYANVNVADLFDLYKPKLHYFQRPEYRRHMHPKSHRIKYHGNERWTPKRVKLDQVRRNSISADYEIDEKITHINRKKPFYDDKTTKARSAGWKNNKQRAQYKIA